MLYLTIFIYEIKYSDLLEEIKSSLKPNKTSSSTGFRDSLLGLIEPILPTLESMSLTRNIISKQLNKIAMKYGITIHTYLDKDQAPYDKSKEGNNKSMLTLSISIANIDYQKIINEIKKSSPKNDNTIVSEIINIIEPFAADTLKTIPPSAIADLFKLLGQEKIIDLANKYGLELTELKLISN